MADAHAAAGAAPGVGHAAHEQETRLILLPVDLDEASVGAVQWAANNVLRAGACVRTCSRACARLARAAATSAPAPRALGLQAMRHCCCTS
jgi:hypothetical protein